ncbi:MAG: RICIN domain-containing protein [Verrucomicrobiales bacterium]
MKVIPFARRAPWHRRRKIIHVLALLGAGVVAPTQAEDWGAFSIIPVGGPSMVLEAVNAGTADGTVVSIGKPSGAAHQKWVIVPKSDGFVSDPAGPPTEFGYSRWRKAAERTGPRSCSNPSVRSPGNDGRLADRTTAATS